jgi:hypothetical protein
MAHKLDAWRTSYLCSPEPDLARSAAVPQTALKPVVSLRLLPGSAPAWRSIGNLTTGVNRMGSTRNSRRKGGIQRSATLVCAAVVAAAFRHESVIAMTAPDSEHRERQLLASGHGSDVPFASIHHPVSNPPVTATDPCAQEEAQPVSCR